MKIIDTIGRALRFDEPDGRFELLETERGEPSFFHGENPGPTPRTTDRRTVPGSLKESRQHGPHPAGLSLLRVRERSLRVPQWHGRRKGNQ